MCTSCWEKAGRPTGLPATYDQFAELHEMLYDMHSVGGPLHTVLDDWNVDGHIEPYPGMTYEDPYDQADITEPVYAAAQQIADLLNDMTEAQRYAALAKASGLL